MRTLAVDAAATSQDTSDQVSIYECNTYAVVLRPATRASTWPNPSAIEKPRPREWVVRAGLRTLLRSRTQQRNSAAEVSFIVRRLIAFERTWLMRSSCLVAAGDRFPPIPDILDRRQHLTRALFCVSRSLASQKAVLSHRLTMRDPLHSSIAP